MSKLESQSLNLFIGMLAVFFIFSSHYLQINRSGVGLELPFNTMGWIPLSAAIGLGLFVVARKELVRYTELSARLLVVVCLLILPVFLPSANQEAVLDRMLGLLAGILILLCLQQFKFNSEQKLLLLLLVIVAVWVEIIIEWDRFFRSMGIGTSETRGVWRGATIGVFQQRNLFSSFIATGIVLSGYLLGYSSGINGRKFQAYFPVLLLLPVAGIYLLEMTISRTGWFGASLGVLLVLPYLWRHADKWLAVGWALSLLCGFFLHWALQVNDMVEMPVVEKEILSIEGLRQVHIPQTIEMALDKPLLGYGYGRFEKSYLEYTADKYAQGLTDEPAVSRLDHAHNELLFWAVEGGIYSLSLLLLAAFFVLKRVIRLPWVHGLAIVGVFFPIVLHTQVEYPFYQSVLHFVVFIIFIYWVDGLTAEKKTLQIKSTLLLGLSAVLVPVVTTVFMVTTLYSGYLFARYESGIDPNIESLQKMVNPVVYSDRINWAIMSRLVLTGAMNNQPQQALPYIEWAPQLLEDKPRPNFYRFLVLAYRVVGDEVNRLRVQQEAEYLFPGERFDAPDLQSSLESPVPFDAISR